MTSSTIASSKSRSWLRRLLPVSFALALTLTFGTADAWAKANAAPAREATPPAESVQATRARLAAEFPGIPLAAIDDDLVEYAQREAQAEALENFHGGDVVIIGSSGLIILLLIILIIVIV